MPRKSPKSRAEIQKAYRERQKQKEGDAYRERERKRKRQAYIPVSELNEITLKKRRMDQTARVQKYRKKQKEKQLAAEKGAEASSSHKRQTRSGSKATEDVLPHLVVKFNFSQAKKRSATRTRVSRALSKAHRKIGKLSEENKKLQNKAWKLQKRIQRSGKSTVKEKKEHQASMPSVNTPRSRSRAQLKEAGLSPSSVPPAIKKKLVFANALMQEVKASTSKDKPKKKVAPKILAGSKIIKRYRLLRQLKRETGLSKRSLQLKPKAAEKKATLIRRQMTEKVTDFLSRDDNSRMMPGKADYKTHEGVKIQKRYLNDYLDNLFAKFKAENPELKISRAQFCKLRPSYILTTSFTSRNTCLCQRHQNVALKLRSLKAMGIKVHTSPDAFMKHNGSDSIDDLLSQCEPKVKYSQWKRVDVEGKKKMKIVQIEVDKADFIKIFKEEIKEFEAHAERVKVQYGELKTLKSNLPKGHMIVQMDFAENYSCQSVEEVQSAYWNSTMVTLHPAVAYYKDPVENGLLIHRSTVFISDELAHNAATVYAILRKLMPELKSILPDVSFIHYFTDSPTSQYRNKTIFHILTQHKKEFGIPASWHYFEAGHGKGPCDGVGGSTKRMADEAVRQQKATIQDADDFFLWAQEHTANSSIKYLFVSKERCSDAQAAIDAFGILQPVAGTMKLHAVIPATGIEGYVAVRNTSCFCANCFADGSFIPDSACGWKKFRTKALTVEGTSFIKLFHVLSRILK